MLQLEPTFISKHHSVISWPLDWLVKDAFWHLEGQKIEPGHFDTLSQLEINYNYLDKHSLA